MKWNDEGFVDLYDLLDVWPDVEPGALRVRISELYLEARDNLEHQNHRKRFYYRELYELQLPRARSILLDEKHRKEYDRELQLFWKNKGKPPTPQRPKDASRPKLADLPGTASPASAAAAPADDFSDFAEITEDKLPPLQIPHLTMDKEAVERRRDNKRRELIKHELIVTGYRWMLLGGGSVVLAGALLIFMFYMALGASTALFVTGAVLTLAAAALAGRQTMRWAKRRAISLLSQMPYDELMRHCMGR